ncbi:MAG: YcaO-like family protein [Chloroflexales bacterium]|nr:YcaO-like family protein [Chloroflexales bacterium]
MLNANCKPYLLAADLRSYAHGVSLLIAPDGSMYHIDHDPHALSALLSRCDGTNTVAKLTASDRSLHTILDTLEESACLSLHQPVARTAEWKRFAAGRAQMDGAIIAQTHLVLTGHTALAQLVAAYRSIHCFASVSIVDDGGLMAALDAHAPSELVLLALYCSEDAEALTRIDDLCEQRGIRWLSLRFAQDAAWLGPAIIPGQTASYRDLIDRRTMAAEDQVMLRALLAPPIAPEPDAPCTLGSPPELTWVITLLITELQRWIASAPCRLISAELHVDPLTQEQTSYPVLPHPRRDLGNDFAISAEKDIPVLLNARSGIITDLIELRHHPSIPPVFRTVQARLAQNPDWLNDPLSMSSFCDLTRARDSDAISEAAFQAGFPIGLEAVPPQVLLHAAKYYCDSNFYAAQARLADYDELTRMGEVALDPQRLALFSAAMYNTPGCPFAPFQHDTPAYWVAGHSLTRDCPAWLPAHLVYVNWQLADFVREHTPLTQSASYAGLAAGWTLEDALVGAIEDCIRRDTMMIWWFNRHPLPSIQRPPALADLWASEPAERGQHARLIYLPNQFGLPVIAGVLENSVEQLLTIGFGYGSDPLQAALQAWAEAATSQEASRDMNDPHGLTRQSIEQGLMNDAFKPWRADRAYLDDYRADFRDMTDPLVQRQFYLDPRAIERVRPWIETPATLTFADIPAQPVRSLRAYREQIEAQGFELFWFDLTPPDLAITGITVVRVIIPGLVPHFPAAFPAVGNGRVQRVPVEMQWRATPLAEDALNYIPLPGA